VHRSAADGVVWLLLTGVKRRNAKGDGVEAGLAKLRSVLRVCAHVMCVCLGFHSIISHQTLAIL
jgi:hypothetical protein